MPSKNIAKLTLSSHVAGPGHYVVTGHPPVKGDWTFEATCASRTSTSTRRLHRSDRRAVPLHGTAQHHEADRGDDQRQDRQPGADDADDREQDDRRRRPGRTLRWPARVGRRAARAACGWGGNRRGVRDRSSPLMMPRRNTIRARMPDPLRVPSPTPRARSPRPRPTRDVLDIVAAAARDVIGARHGVARRGSNGAPPGPRLVAPLIARDGSSLGLIELWDKDGEFTRNDEAIVIQLAQMAANAIETLELLTRERAARVRGRGDRPPAAAREAARGGAAARRPGDRGPAGAPRDRPARHRRRARAHAARSSARSSTT